MEKNSKYLYIDKLFPNEEEECIAFYDYTQLIPTIKNYIVHFTNEGKRSVSYGRRLKRIGGIPKGFPDFCIFLPNRIYHSLFIEMKKRDQEGKKQRNEQNIWIERLLKIGHYATFTYGCNNAIQVVRDYLDNKL